MPRKRMIDPGIWANLQLKGLPVLERLLYIGLISNADDDGRLRGDPIFVKATVFPYDSITPSVIGNGLKRLADRGLILLYQVANEEYIQHPKWNRHQYIRDRRPSTLPPPEGYTPLSTPPPTLKQPNGTQENPKQGKKIICPDCKGSGVVGGPGHERTCWTCKGKRLLWREDYELLKKTP
ncbi:unnamed protein product [marine sediment metagenome]|uniref:Uncharacterized protein n=1 Tax=marine sediment metagenome TaxID=412755 RepID=X1KN61_9ZZZZ